MIPRNCETTFDLAFNTPCIRISTPGQCEATIYIKLEGYNPTGSIKDRACIYLIRKMIETGKLRPGMTILDASSGNMACAIAFYGKVLGYPTTVVTGSKLTLEKMRFINYYDAEQYHIGDFTIDGNRYCRTLADKEPDKYCFLDQLHNWDNPLAHYETTGPEILASFPNVAAVIGSLGSGGSLLGVAQRLKEKSRSIKIIAVQAASGTRIPGVGSFDDGDYVTPFIRKGIDERLFDHIVTIDEHAAIDGVNELKKQGIFCGLQTGGVLQAALTSIDVYGVTGDVVLLSGDSGWKNMDRLMSSSSLR